MLYVKAYNDKLLPIPISNSEFYHFTFITLISLYWMSGDLKI
jgi:hypothetical protein